MLSISSQVDMEINGGLFQGTYYIQEEKYNCDKRWQPAYITEPIPQPTHFNPEAGGSTLP